VVAVAWTVVGDDFDAMETGLLMTSESYAGTLTGPFQKEKSMDHPPRAYFWSTIE
jgi:hypothetical protein